MEDHTPEGSQPHVQKAPDEGDVRTEPRLRLVSLKVNQFRDVRAGTELHFGAGPHLILGKNASGKSTLLQLLAALCTLDFRADFFAETPFQLDAVLMVGEINLQVEVRRKFERVRVKTTGERYLDLGATDDTEVTVKIEVRGALCQWLRVRTGEDLNVFASDPREHGAQGRPIKLLGGVDALRLSLGTVLSHGSTVEIEGSYRVHPLVWQAFLRSTSRPGTGNPFDESLGALDAMTGRPMAVRGDSVCITTPWLPPSLDFEASGGPMMIPLSRDPLLNTVVKQIGYEDAHAYFSVGAPTNGGWRYSSPSFQFFRGGKAVRRHDQLSYGQQRLFSFAWYLACNPDVAVADELVNGLHADWIDWCVKTLGDRQCFLSSQNPLLIDAISFASEDEIRRGIILCESVRDGGQGAGELVWRQLDERESDLLVRAFQQSRVDLPSDLLRALNLW